MEEPILTLDEANRLAGKRARVIRDDVNPGCWAVLYGHRLECTEVHKPMTRRQLEALFDEIGA